MVKHLAGESACSTSLAEEARYFHAAFFQGLPPTEVVDRYIEANRHCFPSIDERQERAIRTIIEQRLDVEAVEFALRPTNPILSRKIQILFFLLEVRARYYGVFVNCGAGAARAWRELLTSLVRAVWKRVKGAYLVRRYGLI